MKISRILVFLCLTAFAIACTPATKITRSWREPAASINRSDTGKVMIMAIVLDAYSRRVIEDQISKQIGQKAVASYLVFTDDMLKSLPADVFSDKLKRDHYKYILIMRLKDIEKESYYVPGSSSGFTGYYGSYGMYYGYSISLYNTPGYIATDKNYTVETTVYSVEPDKLLWTGTSTTANPDKLRKAVIEYSDAVSFQMKKDGFLK